MRSGKNLGKISEKNKKRSGNFLSKSLSFRLFLLFEEKDRQLLIIVIFYDNWIYL